MVDLAAGVRDTVARLHSLKTAYYESAVQQGAVQLRAGVLAMIEQAHQAGLKMAIATTTSPVNISTLLRQAIGDDWRHYFAVVEDAAPRRKKSRTRRFTCKHLHSSNCQPAPALPLKTLPTACKPPALLACPPSSRATALPPSTTLLAHCKCCPAWLA